MARNPTAGQSWYIRGGRILDPAAERDEVSDLFITNGMIAPLPDSPPEGARVIDCTGMVVAPGFIDLHVHLREPGGEDAETIDSGSAAAAHGGFTTIVSMPNTNPPIDSPDQVAFVRRRADAAGHVRVLPSGCITAGRGGTALADLAGMAAAGAVAFTDDGATVADDSVMRAAMVASRLLGLPVMDHALDPAISGRGVMHDGACSRAMKLAGIPSSAETRIVMRDIELAAETGCRVHIQHVSSAEALDAIRDARSRRTPVSCEVTPHHLALCDTDVRADNTSTKVSPPLRSVSDRKAIRAAVRDGIVQAFATDHAPHSAKAKGAGFEKAPFGMTGLETAIGVTYTTLVKPGIIDLTSWIRLWTTGPAGIINLNAPGLGVGSVADIVVLDLASEWSVGSAGFLSKSANSPFLGWTLTGSAAYTFCGGKLTWNSRTALIDNAV